MITRTAWIENIEKAWLEKPVVWLSGVRRTGKTWLCQSLNNVEYFDCELPRTRQMMVDPQGFLDSVKGKRIVLDEVHRLPQPSEILKIAADHYPDIKVLATGSSTLGASAKFRDTLTNRKRDVRLTPMTWSDLESFGRTELDFRMLRGGLPPFFLSPTLPESDYQEWLDSFWAKDIQELFRLERRSSFFKFVELVLSQSGGIFEATRFSRPCEVSRSTVSNYLEVLEATLVAHVVRPFSSRNSSEIISAPKVFGFDTGFICYFRGWRELRQEDKGVLLEHLVLNELQAHLQALPVKYWRDKGGHEVDFVVQQRGSPPAAIECKWAVESFDPASLLSFRTRYPDGRNIVVANDVGRPFTRNYKNLRVEFVSLATLRSCFVFEN
jgi:predicted AAA+ superfamily ATPase